MKHLLKHFKTLSLSPENAAELKGMILQLAIQGKLTAQWRAEHPELVSGSNHAVQLLESIKAEKARLIKEGKVRKEKPLPEITEAEKLFALPEGWVWCRLGDIGDWGAGATPLRSQPEFYGGSINWYKSGELNNGSIDYPSIEKITEFAFKKTSLRLNKIGDVLIAMYGATIGKTGILNVVGTTNQAVCACTPFSIIKNHFLHLLLKALKSVFLGQGEGGAQPNISRIKIRNQVFALPPIPEQKAIVTTVNQLFAEVEQLEKLTQERLKLKADFVSAALARLGTGDTQKEWAFLQPQIPAFFTEEASVKKLRECILQLAVQGKLTTKWRTSLFTSHPELVSGSCQEQPKKVLLDNGETYEHASHLLASIQAEKARLIKEGKIKKEKPLPDITDVEKPYELSEGWVWCRMQDLCPNISSGSTPPKPIFGDVGIPYLKVYNIRNQKVDFKYRKQFVDEDYHSTKLKRSILEPGDVIMNIVGPPLGKIAIIPNDYPQWNCNQAISFFKPLEKELTNWLYTYLCAGTFLEKIELIGTAGQDNISVTKSKNIVIPLPPLPEQKAIVAKVNSLMGLCDQLEAQIKKQKVTQKAWIQSSIKEALKAEPYLETKRELLMAAEPEVVYGEAKVMPLPNSQEPEEKHFLKRKVLASYLINQSLDDPHFGDTKFEKLLHLADYHVLKRDFGQKYYKKTAGPYDNAFTYAFFNQVTKAKWFKKEKVGKLNRITAAENQSKSVKTYDYFSVGELASIDLLIQQFKDWSYKEAEIVSTLYAVWNNRLIKQQPITDELLKADFLAWDAQKAQYKDRLDGALAWMRNKAFVPTGWGKVVERKKPK